MSVLTIDKIRQVCDTAKQIYLTTAYTERVETVQDRKVRYIVSTDNGLNEFIQGTISDGGLTLLSTWEDYVDLWVRLRDEDPITTVMLQMATSFRALAFANETEYLTWTSHLATAISIHTTTAGGVQITSNTSTANVPSTVDNDLIDRLPSKDTMGKILGGNAWITFLATLALVWHEILSDIVSTIPLHEFIEKHR
jgi:hypothetical protein